MFHRIHRRIDVDPLVKFTKESRSCQFRNLLSAINCRLCIIT